MTGVLSLRRPSVPWGSSKTTRTASTTATSTAASTATATVAPCCAEQQKITTVVRFNPTVDFYEVSIPGTAPFREDAAAIWLQDEDYHRMDSDNVATLKLMMSYEFGMSVVRNSSEDDRVAKPDATLAMPSCCTRGLEHLFPERKRLLRELQQVAWNVVIDEQQRQWREDILAPEAIADLYSRITLHPGEVALYRGLMDAKVVQEMLKAESQRKSSRKGSFIGDDSDNDMGTTATACSSGTSNSSSIKSLFVDGKKKQGLRVSIALDSVCTKTSKSKKPEKSKKKKRKTSSKEKCATSASQGTAKSKSTTDKGKVKKSKSSKKSKEKKSKSSKSVTSKNTLDTACSSKKDRSSRMDTADKRRKSSKKRERQDTASVDPKLGKSQDSLIHVTPALRVKHSVGRLRETVHFSTSIDVFESQMGHCTTDNDWFTRRQIARIQTRCKILAQKLKKRLEGVPEIKYDEVRGLEHFFYEQQRKSNMEGAINAVLDEQERQTAKYQTLKRPARMAKVYKAAAKDCAQEAIRRALLDEKVAQDILKPNKATSQPLDPCDLTCTSESGELYGSSNTISNDVHSTSVNELRNDRAQSKLYTSFRGFMNGSKRFKDILCMSQVRSK